MIRLNPRTFGLEGFFEKSLYYLELYNEEIDRLEDEDAPVEEIEMLLNVVHDISIRLSLVFDYQWYDKLNDYD